MLVELDIAKNAESVGFYSGVIVSRTAWNIHSNLDKTHSVGVCIRCFEPYY